MIRRFSVQVDDPGDLLTITLRGFWDEGVVYAYIVELETAVGRLSCGAGRHRVIVDLTDWNVQSQAVLGKMVDYLTLAEPKPARMAWVGRGGLQRLQLGRTITRFDGGCSTRSTPRSAGWRMAPRVSGPVRSTPSPTRRR